MQGQAAGSMMQQGAGNMSMSSVPQTGGMAAGMGQQIGGLGAGQQMMSEDAYIQHCRQFTAQKGVPFNVDQVRQYYRQMRAMLGQ